MTPDQPEVIYFYLFEKNFKTQGSETVSVTGSKLEHGVDETLMT